jgi:ribose transport system ATP-binding protein
VLTLSHIRKRFGPTVALDGVDLALTPGRVHAIIGENGAGKSTLLNVIAGAVVPDAGTLALDGRPFAPASPLEGRQRGIALIHQELSLCPHLTVAENVLMGQETTRGGLVDWEACRQRAAAVLEEFHHPELEPDRRVRDLPISARQVVEICRAIASDASVVLMDEPTSSLPREDVERLFSLIDRLRARGVAVAYISHFLEEVRAIADDCTVLRDGRSVAHGAIADVTDAELIAHMVGREMSDVFPARDTRHTGEVVFEVDALDAPGVRDARFTLRRGEVLGIAGLVGAGRTELLRALVGLERAVRGRVRLHGREVPRSAPASSRLGQGIGFVSEDRKGEGLAVLMSLADNVTCTRYERCATFGWLDLAEQSRQAWRHLQALGVKAHSPRQPARSLSGGNQQKVALARLLHQGADVWLLDEPTKGIDIGSKLQIYEAIGRAASGGAGVLMVSSYLPELFGVCDSLAVMTRGRLSPARPISQWTPESVLQAAIGT